MLKHNDTVNVRKSISIAIIGAIGGMKGGIPVINPERKGVIIPISTASCGLNIYAAIKIGRNIGKNAAPRPNW